MCVKRGRKWPLLKDEPKIRGCVCLENMYRRTAKSGNMYRCIDYECKQDRYIILWMNITDDWGGNTRKMYLGVIDVHQGCWLKYFPSHAARLWSTSRYKISQFTFIFDKIQEIIVSLRDKVLVPMWHYYRMRSIL